MDSEFLTQIVSIVISIVIMWKLFTKAGEEGWKSIIPVYNLYIVFKITWGSGWMFLLLLIPIVNIYVIIKTCINTAHAFGKGGWFAAGLFFLSPIFGLILAFSNCQYLGVPSKVHRQVEYENGPDTSSGNNYSNNTFNSNNNVNYTTPPTTDSDLTEPAAPVNKRKICPSCGFPVPDDVKYCPGCGTKL